MNTSVPSPSELFLLGASHHAAPLELREKLALTAEKLAIFPTRVAGLTGLRELAILNTCNRIEFYGVVEHREAVERLQAEFCTFQGVGADLFAKIRLHATGRQTVAHLLSVASGLDSQMLGETEILGQVKEAYAQAQARRHTGPVLHRLFQKAFQAAKYVRTHTSIGEGQISVANVAVDLAQTIFGNLSATRILLLGAGDIGEKTARAFQSRGGTTLTVASRRLGRAMELATVLNASALPFEHVADHLGTFDVVVCSTAAPQAIISAATASAALRRRPAQPLFFIDLALPRDVDAAVARLQNVFLYNLDDLARIAEENRAAREAELARCRAILDEKADALWKQIEPRMETDRPAAASPSPRSNERLA